MEPAFRARFAERGKLLNVMGSPVRDMPRDDLYAVIGLLLEAASDSDVRARLGELISAGALPESETKDAEDPPSNNGIFEG